MFEENWNQCIFFLSAYQNNDITEFEKILKTNHSNIMDDPFIREHIEGMGRLLQLIISHVSVHVFQKHILKV